DETNHLLAYHYLPGFSPEFLRACNYASHLNIFSRHIINAVGFERPGYDGSQDYDFELRVVEKARAIRHIPKVLYYCRAGEGSVALDPTNKMYAYEAGRLAIQEHIQRIGYPGRVEFLPTTYSYRIHYDIVKPGKITVVIPNADHVDLLKKCVDSILAKTDYGNYDILILENNSKCNETFAYYASVKANERIRVMTYPFNAREFNYSALNNYAVKQTDASYILFMNNDMEVINGSWMTEMLMFAQREDVGAVGAKLYYPNGAIQHSGLLIGLGGHIASSYDHGKDGKETGYMHRLTMPQNFNAVTAACMMLKKADFEAVRGFVDVSFKVGLNDIDLCLKLRALRRVNVITPYAELYHHESATRGLDSAGDSKKRFEEEKRLFRAKWHTLFEQGDEYDHKGLTL
ncbi:MAG: glycosyltransferase, partial [Candidatus Cloacimonetes bacterium]|nr:glycosyltransferase [Candidatus Cloacimonadota bacterium]